MCIKAFATLTAVSIVASTIPLIAGPAVPAGQKARPVSAAAGAITFSPNAQITVSADYVTTSLTNFVKESYQIAPGKDHDARLLAALLKDGAHDEQAPQLTTTVGVKGELTVNLEPQGPQAVLPLTSSIQATPRLNTDGSFTVDLSISHNTTSAKIPPGTTPSIITSHSVTTTGTFIDGQTLLIEFGSGSYEPTDPDHRANVSASSASLIFVTVKSSAPR